MSHPQGVEGRSELQFGLVNQADGEQAECPHQEMQYDQSDPGEEYRIGDPERDLDIVLAQGPALEIARQTAESEEAEKGPVRPDYILADITELASFLRQEQVIV